MKKLVTLFFIVSIIILFSSLGTAYAKTQPLTKEEVEKLIEERLGDDKPLTEEELTKVVLELKDEKIENLEGNISSVIDTFGLFIAIAAFILTLISGVIGFYFKRKVDDKLTSIEQKETTVKEIQMDITNKANTIKEHYDEMKAFSEKLNETTNQLKKNSELLTKTIEDLEGLRKYLGSVEEIANSSMLINKFSIQQHESQEIIRETYETIARPQKHLNHTLGKIASKIGLLSGFKDLDALRALLDSEVNSLSDEEKEFFSKVNKIKTVEGEYFFSDEGEDMTLFEELSDIHQAWTSSYEKILTIRGQWNAQLIMNPINQQNQ
jgi:nitrogen fixation/metabolism regulation signal transduction histidine kinase